MERLGVSIPSLKSLAKMRKGHKIRISAGDHHLEIEPHKIKKAISAFKKNKGIHFQMSPDEIQHNEGQGFFDNIKRGFNNKIVKPAAKYVKSGQAGRDANKYLKPVAKIAAKEALNYGKQFLGPAALAATSYIGHPELAPIAHKAGEAGINYLSNKVEGMGVVDDVKDFMRRKSKLVKKAFRKPKVKNAVKPLEPRKKFDWEGEPDEPTEEYKSRKKFDWEGEPDVPTEEYKSRKKFDWEGEPDEPIKNINKKMMYDNITGEGIIDDLGHIARNKAEHLMKYVPSQIQAGIKKHHLAPRSRTVSYDFLNPLATVTSQKAKSDNELQHLERVMAKARILGTGMERGSIGIHGNLLGHQAVALESQPHSANFQFSHTLPPAYAKLNKANGLYASRARGSY